MKYVPAILLGIAILIPVYMRFVRPWQLRWGARPEEIEASLPGDDIVARPSFDATRGVTIRASPVQIWPWIVQIGVNRAGWYSYDLLDNLGRKSAEKILPEFQSPRVGDLIPMSPDGKQGFWVKAFERDRWMLWWDRNGDVSWAWVLLPIDGASTRLITRVRMSYRWSSLAAIFNLIVEFFDIVMMRKCMLEIKERAEKTAAQGA